MHIRFFGVTNSFDYHHIGGTDSFFRRIGADLCRRGHTVAFVHYGGPVDAEESSSPIAGLRIKRFRHFESALEELSRESGPVFVNAIRARDRLRFIRFRRRLARQIGFFMVYSMYAETWSGRWKHFLESRIYPYNAGTLCMSQRLVEHTRRLTRQPRLVLPPVPPSYYAGCSDKRKQGKIVVSYVGRMESGKGAPEAAEVLSGIVRDGRFQTCVSAYAFTNDDQAQAMEDRLVSLPGLRYDRCEYQNWSLQLEYRLARLLYDTDVLLLPYQRLSSTIDIPLLLLEGMAAQCCCLIPSLGDISTIYGESPFLVEPNNFVTSALELLHRLSWNDICRERQRVRQRIHFLQVDVESVTNELLNAVTSYEAKAA